ncbi:hypothetical protein CTI12_AA126650 [Artemisia annua]|uniref:Zinc finger, RING/FYVE/PHD-type n=1 Tax=Artemisia annua TaxID=35608 RepID=A0A2U1PPW6_ARTAN|nr:hypothetical protein CTI12_AA126650 [Artemisia annua]
MPKDRRSSSLDRYRVSPYSRCHKNAERRKPKSPTLPIGNENEWEEARCPICIEHPHNAVLLLCSSREKGCLPYICNTSSRHSNCLDQFRKSSNNEGAETKLVCPLCRGQINGSIVVNPARQFMDSKIRSCSLDTCDYAGNYSQLRKHARCKHPRVRPTDVDPERELKWRNLEEEMEQQDMLSMQFDFDEIDDEVIEELLDGVSDISSPIWDHGLETLDYIDFLSTFDSVLPEMGIGEVPSGLADIEIDIEEVNSLFSDEWSNTMSFLSSHESESRDSGRSRSARANNRLPPRPRENPPTTRSRTNTNRRLRTNNQPNLHNRQGQRGATWFTLDDIWSDLS